MSTDSLAADGGVRAVTWPRLPAPGRFLALAAGSIVVSLVLGFVSQWTPWVENASSLTDSGWADLTASIALYVWAVAPVVALWRPFLGGALAAAPFLITLSDAASTWPFVLYVSLLCCAAVAAWRSRRAAVVIAGSALVPVLTYLLGLTSIATGYGFVVDRGAADVGELMMQFLLYALVAAAAVGLGTWMRSSYLSAERASALETRAADVERTSAVVDERARLARDLHDVVAHHVSLIAVRAETAPYTTPDLSPSATALLAEIAEDSRRALDELRGVLGILGRSAEGPELAPQPGAADVETLVEAARRGGDDVRWSPVDVSAVARQAGYVAYRVVQEALTNARRHAPGAAVMLDVVPVGRGVLVRVENPVAVETVVVAVPGLGVVDAATALRDLP